MGEGGRAPPHRIQAAAGTGRCASFTTHDVVAVDILMVT